MRVLLANPRLQPTAASRLATLAARVCGLAATRWAAQATLFCTTHPLPDSGW